MQCRLHAHVRIQYHQKKKVFAPVMVSSIFSPLFGTLYGFRSSSAPRTTYDMRQGEQEETKNTCFNDQFIYRRQSVCNIYIIQFG